MKEYSVRRFVLAAALFATCSLSVSAQLFITEVAPWSSGNSSLGADWFELTNRGASAVTLTGWKVDDNSNSFASALTLNGISSIAAGESVIFVESATSLAASFKTLWFGSNAPAGLQIGNYSGSGIGFGTGGDAVNVYNAAGTLQANVVFGASPGSAPFATFDNKAGLNNATISLLSVNGVNGAFIAANAPTEIGSPGFAPIPEPSTYALLVGFGALGLAALRRKFASVL